MTDKTEVEEALIKASEMLTREGGKPESMWHPNFGWVLLDGKPTDTSEAFWKWVQQCREET